MGILSEEEYYIMIQGNEREFVIVISLAFKKTSSYLEYKKKLKDFKKF